MTPEMKIADDNFTFEQKMVEEPLPDGTGEVKIFGYETWDINDILKGNYWGRSIYTTDKICKLFLKWNLERQKKYLRKKNTVDFNWMWLIIIIIGGAVALIMLLILLPSMGIM